MMPSRGLTKKAEKATVFRRRGCSTRGRCSRFNAWRALHRGFPRRLAIYPERCIG